MSDFFLEKPPWTCTESHKEKRSSPFLPHPRACYHTACFGHEILIELCGRFPICSVVNFLCCVVKCYYTESFRHDSLIELCGKLCCMRGTPDSPCFSTIVPDLPTKTKVESGTSQSKSGTSVEVTVEYLVRIPGQASGTRLHGDSPEHSETS